MRILNSQNLVPGLCLAALLACLSPAAFSASANLDWLESTNSATQGFEPGMLAQSDNPESDKAKPRSGSLVLPAAADEDKSEKKCMTVCGKRGKNCVIDSVRGTRKCMPVCKEYVTECF